MKHGVTIIGAANLARSLAADASALFARNLYNFLAAFWDKDQAREAVTLRCSAARLGSRYRVGEGERANVATRRGKAADLREDAGVASVRVGVAQPVQSVLYA